MILFFIYRTHLDFFYFLKPACRQAGMPKIRPYFVYFLMRSDAMPFKNSLI
tara:strand:+ start:610 stop:762 length:153 start_codon:yes stop_codon:yes gene_type:complete